MYTVKNNYSIWSKTGDRSVKRVKSYSKWSEIYSKLLNFEQISSKILLFLQSDPLFYSIWSNYFYSVFMKLTFWVQYDRELVWKWPKSFIFGLILATNTETNKCPPKLIYPERLLEWIC